MFILLFRGYSQDEYISQPVKLMFYNVENLFDCSDDPLKDDEAFLPEGVMRWNYKRYSKKINSVYKAIVAAGEWSPPAVVAFCEIENKKILEDLIFRTYLSKYEWGIIHEDSPDERGIDVCLIFRKDLLKVIEAEYWFPSSIEKKIFFSRGVLYAKFAILNDTIHTIVNHWPSRRGGVLAGEGMRIAISEMIRANADSISDLYSGKAKIILMGDFNCTPDDPVVQKMINPGGSVSSGSSLSLVNLTDELAANGSGTYRYNGIWEMIDQIIVSGWLLNCRNGLYTDKTMFSIFKPDFLLKGDPTYPGVTPYSTYRGYRYQGGFSDHLPVIVDLRFR